MESLEDQSLEELQANLSEYRGQLQQACRFAAALLLCSCPLLAWGTDFSRTLLRAG